MGENEKMKVSLIYKPEEREWMLFKRAIRVTMGKVKEPKELPSSELKYKVLRARHSPCRVLNFAFLIENIPSNTSVHLCRHVHALPFVSSLRNDRQTKIDGDKAPRDTPVDMILYCNAEELMTIANKRLCMKASPRTREVVGLMCLEAMKEVPELRGLLVPMCEYLNCCNEIDGCGRWERENNGKGNV